MASWVNLRQKLSDVEIVDIAREENETAIPLNNVVYDEKRIKNLIYRIDPSKRPKKEKKRHPQDGVMREFIDLEERQQYIEEFGPYGMALINDYERDYFRNRKEQILKNDDFELDPDFDMSIIMMVIMDEIIQQRFLEQMSVTPTNAALNKQVTEIQRRYRENLRILDATREQRNAPEDSKLDSLAAAVLMFHKNEEQRILELKKYDEEEEALLKRVASKPPPELDYIEVSYEEIEE